MKNKTTQRSVLRQQSHHAEVVMKHLQDQHRKGSKKVSHLWEIATLTEAFERGVSVELGLGGALVGGRQLGQVMQGVVEGGLGFGVVVFTGKQGASSCQLSIVHPRGAFYKNHREKTTAC